MEGILRLVDTCGKVSEVCEEKWRDLKVSERVLMLIQKSGGKWKGFSG